MSEAMLSIPSFPLKAVLLLFALVVLVPVGATLGSLKMAGQPMASRTGMVTAGACAVLFFAIWGMCARSSVRRDGDRLVISAGFNSTSVPSRSVAIDGIEAVDCSSANSPHPLRARLNGLGLPGYYSGWFAGDGGRRIFAVGVGRRCLFVPTHDSFDLLIGTDDAANDAARLRKLLA